MSGGDPWSQASTFTQWVGTVVACVILLGAGAWAGARRREAQQAPARVRSALGPVFARLSREHERAWRAATPAPEAPRPSKDPPPPKTLREQREQLFDRMARDLAIAPEAMRAVRAIFERSELLGQGNPSVTRYSMTRAECRAARASKPEDRGAPALCGAPFMVPLYDPSVGQAPESAKACIDQYEFPNLPCEYPVVYARASEAAELCAALGKRLCDAHEWEGACAGAVRDAEVEYAWGKPRSMATRLHNEDREVVWAYGKQKDHGRCGTAARKSKGCVSGGWKLCGTNSYPTGSFPECKSALGVYDQHGNVAEHMNLPLAREELASAGGSGHTEMKGSWFVFRDLEAHEDDCRWRAKDWHPSKVSDPESHRNYHLGFRCCRDRAPADARPASASAP